MNILFLVLAIRSQECEKRVMLEGRVAFFVRKEMHRMEYFY
jgi:hypothetical protein